MTDYELNAAQFARWIAYDLHGLLAANGDQRYAELWLYAEVLESLAQEPKAVLRGEFDAKHNRR
jgi:hypothetical protein